MGRVSLIDESKDLLYLCMYSISNFVFSADGRNLSLNQSNILSIDKIDNFETKLRSILKVQLSVDIRQKIWILANKSNITCKFEFSKFGMDSDVENEVRGQQTAWNQEFAVYLTDDDASIDVEALESELRLVNGDSFSIDDIDGVDYYNSQTVFDIYLYNLSFIKPSTHRVGDTYTSDILANIVGDIITKSKHKHVLLSPIENSTVYDELLLPSYKAYEALVYLDQYYGLYKVGASIFYDIDRMYIINANGKSTAVSDGEWPETNFLISPRETSTPGNGMVYRQKENVYYINVPEENVSPNNPSDSIKVEYGESIQIVTTDDIKVDTTGNSSNSYIAYMKSTDNQFATDIINARMKENDSIIYITGDNFDVNAFTLNKAFKVTYADPTKQKKYGSGCYRIAYAQHAWKIQSDSYMRSSHWIVLKRCS